MACKFTVALAGNPNCGKTTLFNRLTDGSQHVGNWPGVTVEMRTGAAGEAEIIDLPGTYALTAASPEERIAADDLRSGHADAVVCVIDAGCMERGLFLLSQLAELQLPLIVALNMMDEVRRRGGAIDTRLMSRLLGVPVIPMTARTGEGVRALTESLTEAGYCLAPRVTGDEAAQIQARYTWADRIVERCVKRTQRDSLSERLDRILLHPLAAYPCLAALLLLIMGAVYGSGTQRLSAVLQSWIEAACQALQAWLNGLHVAPILSAMITEAILPGVGSVIAFAPMLLMLFLCTTFLEDSGYMARAAFILDKPMQCVGLSGKCLYPLLMGFGCTVSAVTAARGIADEGERRRTHVLAPFLSCSAKTPVYMMLAAAFFPAHAGFVTAGILLAGVLLAAAAGLCLKHASPPDDALFLLEMPPYRVPSMRTVLRGALRHTLDFLRRVSTVILLAAILTWLARSFTWSLRPADSFQFSMLGAISGTSAKLLRPLGFGSPEAAAALIAGLAAKENIISTLAILTSGELRSVFASPAEAMSFLAFVMLYSPCAAALAAISREAGARTAIRVAISQTLLAWAAAFLLRNVLVLIV